MPIPGPDMSAPDTGGIAGPLEGAGADQPNEQRVQKAEVNYQERPHQGDECDECTNFQPPPKGSQIGSCVKVMGAINPKGWCTEFKSQEQEMQARDQQQMGQPIMTGVGGGPGTEGTY
jgi:hypothetical protein